MKSSSSIHHLDVNAAVRVLATGIARARARPASTVAVAASVVTRVVAALFDNDNLVAVHPGDERGEAEHEAVHDAERKARLEHVARLAVAPVVAEAGDLVAADKVGPVFARVGVVALRQADGRDEVGRGNEGAEDQSVDEAHEQGVVRGSVVREERKHGPCQRNHRHDEHDEDRVGRECVVADKDVDEPGEHGHCAELRGVRLAMLRG